jgi:hypothetical protein
MRPRSQNRILSPARWLHPRPWVGEVVAGGCFDYDCGLEECCCLWFGGRLERVPEVQQREEESSSHWKGKSELGADIDIALASRGRGKRGTSPGGATTSGRFEVAMSEQLADVSAHRRGLHGLGKGFDMSASIRRANNHLVRLITPPSPTVRRRT